MANILHAHSCVASPSFWYASVLKMMPTKKALYVPPATRCVVLARYGLSSRERVLAADRHLCTKAWDLATGLRGSFLLSVAV